MRKKTLHILTLLSVIVSPCNISAQQIDTPKIKWTLLSTLPSSQIGVQSGLAGAFAGASGKIMWIAGGSNFSNGLPWEGGSKIFHDTVFFFQKGKNGIKLLSRRAHLPAPVAYGTGIAWHKGVVCAGGQNESGFSRKVFFAYYNTAKALLEYKNITDLPHGLANATGAVCDNTIYIAGGETAEGPTDSFLSLDMGINGAKWKTLPKLPVRVSHAVMIAQFNGKDTALYLIGGRRKDISGISELYSGVYRYDIKTASWQVCTPMPYALSAHTGIAFPGNQIMIIGGDKGVVFNKVERSLVAIEKETDPAQKAALVNIKNALQNNHPGFSREILLYNTITGKWKPIGLLPFPAPVTTTAFMWNGSVIIPSGEIKAGVRSPEIWMGTEQ